SVFADLFEVIAELLAILKDFFFAGSVADIALKLGPILSQLLVIAAQLPSILLDFIAGTVNIFEILSNLGLVVMTAVLMVNIMFVFMLFTTSVMPVFPIFAPVMASILFGIVS